MLFPQVSDLPAVRAVIDLRSGDQILGGSCGGKCNLPAVCMVQGHGPSIFILCLQQQCGHSICHLLASFQDHFLM